MSSEDCLYVSLITISRMTCCMSHPLSTNVDASQSSNSRWVGGAPWLPKSSVLELSPRPNKRDHNRFTTTRAVSGLSVSNSQSAKARRIELIVADCTAKEHGRSWGHDIAAFVEPVSAWQKTHRAWLR